MQIGSPETGTGPTLDHHPGNSLFVAHGVIRPVWRLLLYLAILFTPVFLLALATRLAGAGAAQQHHAGALMLSPLTAIAAELAQLSFVLFATWIMSRIENRSVLSYGLQNLSQNVGLTSIGALWGLLFMSLLIGILWSTHYLVFTGVLLGAGRAVAYGIAWAVNFVLVGLFEETLFRGYLQFILALCFAVLVRRFASTNTRAEAIGFWIAAVLINFGFGFAHGSNPGESPVGLLCAGVAGLLFAFSLWRTGVLWWAIGLHAAWDWAQSYVYGVADSGTVASHHLLGSHPNGPVLLSGGATGPEGSVFVLPIMLLIMFVIILTLRERRASESPLALAPAEAFTPAPQVNSPRA